MTLEGFITFEVNHFIDKHGEWLVREEEVFFLHVKDTLWVWIGSGTEVTGDGGSGVDSVNFAAVMSYEGILSRELLEGGRNQGFEDVARLRDCSDLRCDLLSKAVFGGSFGAARQLWPRVAATSLHHRSPRRRT
jgi:hypothetical protein